MLKLTKALFGGIFMSQLKKTVLLSGVAAVAVLMSGCVVAPPHVVHNARHQAIANGATVNVEYYQSAPPAEYNEVITVSPGDGYIWVPGLWYWSGNRYLWRAGNWQRPPSGYRTYNRGTWNHTPGRGWYHSGGHWR